MNKKGFTLIELLAVIVILAIIALIATPIVLNIIEDSKKSAFKQTGNGIVGAAEYYYMKEMSDGAKPTENKVFTFNGSTNGLEGLEFDGEIPKEGTLTVDVNGKIRLEAHNNQFCITKGYEENEITIKDYDGSCEVPVAPICALINDVDNSGTVTAGDKYQCKVKETMESDWEDGYYFYVLSENEDGTINLIMDRNVYYDSSTDTSGAVTESNTGFVAWISDSAYGCVIGEECMARNNKGPITAMDYLYNATKDWTNIEPINYEYNDKEVQETIESDASYISFESTNGVATITPLSGEGVTIGSEAIPLRARMPIYASNTTITEVANSNGSNKYLYENLTDGYWEYDPSMKPTNNISNIIGYWTLSSVVNHSSAAWTVEYSGGVRSCSNTTSSVSSSMWYGVRPVINLKNYHLQTRN